MCCLFSETTVALTVFVLLGNVVNKNADFPTSSPFLFTPDLKMFLLIWSPKFCMPMCMTWG